MRAAVATVGTDSTQIRQRPGAIRGGHATRALTEGSIENLARRAHDRIADRLRLTGPRNVGDPIRHAHEPGRAAARMLREPTARTASLRSTSGLIRHALTDRRVEVIPSNAEHVLHALRTRRGRDGLIRHPHRRRTLRLRSAPAGRKESSRKQTNPNRLRFHPVLHVERGAFDAPRSEAKG